MEDFIRILLQSLVTTAWIVVLGRVLMSWIDPQFQRPLGQFLFSLTEPFLAPLRNVLPRAGMFDLSPLVLLLGLGLLMRMTWYL
ncbi:MAG: YggT family protein [Chloroflexota bacterium]